MESRTIYRVFSKSGAVILRKYEILAILLEVDTIFSFYDQNDKISSQPEHIRKHLSYRMEFELVWWEILMGCYAILGFDPKIETKVDGKLLLKIRATKMDIISLIKIKI